MLQGETVRVLSSRRYVIPVLVYTQQINLIVMVTTQQSSVVDRGIAIIITHIHGLSYEQ